jgi:antitoxin component HigA of HigAB toxin-antitoxin module
MARIIHTEAEHHDALTALDRLMEIDPESGTPEADELELLALVLEDYEKARWPIGLPDAVDAIRFCIDQHGLLDQNLVTHFGTERRASEVLAGERPRTLTMMRRLREGPSASHWKCWSKSRARNVGRIGLLVGAGRRRSLPRRRRVRGSPPAIVHSI